MRTQRRRCDLAMSASRARRRPCPAHRRLAPFLLIALLGCGACWRAPSRPPNVVVILIDTLRADRVGWNGGDRKLTPFLDQFASRATVFSHAHASSSWTLPSVASLFTSRFQSQHRMVIFK